MSPFNCSRFETDLSHQLHKHTMSRFHRTIANALGETTPVLECRIWTRLRTHGITMRTCRQVQVSSGDNLTSSFCDVQGSISDGVTTRVSCKLILDITVYVFDVQFVFSTSFQWLHRDYGHRLRLHPQQKRNTATSAMPVRTFTRRRSGVHTHRCLARAYVICWHFPWLP